MLYVQFFVILIKTPSYETKEVKFDCKIFRILIMFHNKNYDFRKIESHLSSICHLIAKIVPGGGGVWK
jgi:hypothetical protein